MRLTKKYLINSILLILLLEWAFPIGFISPTNVPKVQAQTTKTLLQPSDFTYLGYYDVKFSVYGQGLTYRYVNGDLRFLTLTWDNGQGDLLEFSLAGKNLGDSIDTTTNTWPSLMSMGGKLDGLWWDDAKQRLWTESAISYNPNYENTNIITQTLNSNGTVSNVHGPISLEGIGAKRVFGGAQNVPTWFQQLYGVGPYVVGWGGITSLLAEGSVASLGGTMYAIPDPANYADNTIIPANQFKILMDHSSGSTSYDWYSSGSHPTSFDRGERSTVPVNYFDGGDTRPNGNCSGCNGTRPTNPPVPGAGWLSPAPDGIARWTWEDTYTNTGNWIDSTTKTGFVTVADLGGGDVWYCSSDFCTDKKQYEIHIYDPETLGKEIQGQLQPWQVQPASMTEVSLPGIEWGQQGSTSASIAGAVYDPTSHKLYILGLWTQPEIADRLYVFSVNDGSGTNPPFDFALSPASSSLKVMQSNSITNTITSTLSTGTTQNVSFSASGLPTGATASFSPTSCNPTCTTTMTIQTLASTPVGIGTITVTGTGGGATQTITFNLDVNYRGDINNDGIVNSIDWSIMNAHWFTNNAQSDINHDGIVNSIDFSILNSNWFKGG